MFVKQLPSVIDLDMLQRFEFERHLFDHAIPCDRETLSGTKTGAQATGLSQSGTDGMREKPSLIAKAAFRVGKCGASSRQRSSVLVTSATVNALPLA
jgi:hypothetical protein